jgi:Arc/MetJ-type ribon-helix-helix transcriptional regulator
MTISYNVSKETYKDTLETRKDPAMPEEFTQVNTNLTNEDVKLLDRMMVEDAYETRSAFMRRLIRQEWARRYGQPNAGVSIDDAITAGKAV